MLSEDIQGLAPQDTAAKPEQNIPHTQPLQGKQVSVKLEFLNRMLVDLDDSGGNGRNNSTF
jgi:hypothetical protein